MRSMKKVHVANGIFWMEIPEADLRILCGCPADSVKHLIKRGLIAPAEKAGVRFETGPMQFSSRIRQYRREASPTSRSFLSCRCSTDRECSFRDTRTIPAASRFSSGWETRSARQGEYVFRGNYGLASLAEIEASGVTPTEAREMMEIKRWFSFGTIRATTDLVDLRAVDADAVELAPGCVVHRKGFNRYEFIASGESEEVDLALGIGEEFEPAYDLPPRGVLREEFSVIHVGEGDGWDVTRPCMGSILCGGGLFYLVDAGPHITRSLDALGIGPAEVEGIFHTHAHDDHFAGLTSLVRSDRRLKYYAVPYVRASVQKKLAALMRIDEDRFSRYFDVHDLAPGEWNRIGALEVKPVYSPHPVETTVFFFRAGNGAARRVYAHLADIASFEVLCAARCGDGRAVPRWVPAHREAFIREVTSPVDLKKVDVGGGLIHGNADDFRADESGRVLLSHGFPASRTDHSARITTVSFGDADVLIPGEGEGLFRAHGTRLPRLVVSPVPRGGSPAPRRLPDEWTFLPAAPCIPPPCGTMTCA